MSGNGLPKAVLALCSPPLLIPGLGSAHQSISRSWVPGIDCLAGHKRAPQGSAVLQAPLPWKHRPSFPSSAHMQTPKLWPKKGFFSNPFHKEKNPLQLSQGSSEGEAGCSRAFISSFFFLRFYSNLIALCSCNAPSWLQDK